MLRAPVFALCFLSILVGQETRAAGVVEARAALYAEYGQKLDKLATWCQEHQFVEAAEQLKAWLPKRDPGKLTLFVLPSSSEAETGKVPPWRKQWQTLREQQADELVALARQAVSERRLSLCYELVTEAVREDPDHKQARRLLGYVKTHDGWHTRFQMKQLGANKVWSDQFGWLPKSHLERYAKGQRYYQGRWMSVADEAELRRDIKRGWRVESEHYLVTTNHSLEQGVRLAERLEMLYAIWQQVFIAYLADDAELARRFDGRMPRGETRQHSVTYYRTREEYNSALRSSQPQIDITLGIYLDKTRTAYFFAGEDQQPGTLFHEATHQLFHETRPVAPDAGRHENFWVLEGIACYMESLTEQPGYYTLGGRDSGRVPAARERLLDDKFYVPLAQLVRIGIDELQHDSRIAKIYSQSAGLSDFFMHDAAGRYRDPLARYLDAIYDGKATLNTLAQVMGTDYETLDRQYREFLSQSGPAENNAASSR